MRSPAPNGLPWWWAGRCVARFCREPVFGGASRVPLLAFVGLVGRSRALRVLGRRLRRRSVLPALLALRGPSPRALPVVAPFGSAPLVVVRSPLPLPPAVPGLVRLGAVRRVGARSRAPLGVARLRRVASLALLARLGALRLPSAPCSRFRARVAARPVRRPPPSGGGRCLFSLTECMLDKASVSWYNPSCQATV